MLDFLAVAKKEEKMVKSNLKLVNLMLMMSLTIVLVFSGAVKATSMSGVLCKAANLSQALNLGLGHNQNGANNEGSGNFFVVCPLIYENPLISVSLVEVGVRFPPGGGTVNCVARGQNFMNDTFTFESVSITSTTIHGAELETFTPNWSSQSGAQSNATIVCALGPGESIKWIQFR